MNDNTDRGRKSKEAEQQSWSVALWLNSRG